MDALRSAYSSRWLLAPALALTAAGCTTPLQPLPSPRPSPPTVETPRPTPPPEAAPPSPQPPAPPTARLPWVNPLRCLPACAAEPAAELVTVSELGELDAQGHHRVVAAVQPALRALIVAATDAGHTIRVSSAYRSYEAQAKLFANMKEIGRAARPGHSEHQLGTTIDLRLPTGAAISWLASHAAEFAFALSYPPHKQRLTGYRPEPWHIRYVGVELAHELGQSGLTLEELFRARPQLAESGSCADCPLPSSQASCGAITTSGSCRGSVLSFCYDGALATVDCAVSGDRCDRAEGSSDFDCLAGEKAPQH